MKLIVVLIITKALTRALNLEKDSTIALEEEEETYVRELLEEQKVLAEEIIENQNKMVGQVRLVLKCGGKKLH